MTHERLYDPGTIVRLREPYWARLKDSTFIVGRLFEDEWFRYECTDCDTGVVYNFFEVHLELA